MKETTGIHDTVKGTKNLVPILQKVHEATDKRGKQALVLVRGTGPNHRVRPARQKYEDPVTHQRGRTCKAREGPGIERKAKRKNEKKIRKKGSARKEEEGWGGSFTPMTLGITKPGGT